MALRHGEVKSKKIERKVGKIGVYEDNGFNLSVLNVVIRHHYPDVYAKRSHLFQERCFAAEHIDV